MNLYLHILKLLIENKDTEYSIREISKLLKKDYKNTYDAVQKILGSVVLTKKGNASYLKFKPLLTDQIYLVERYRYSALSEKLSLIKKDLNSISNPFFIAIVFGSYAKSTASSNSDIDICLLYDSKTKIKSIIDLLLINPKVELHLFHYSEFLRMIDSKTFNVGHEILNHGIILNNIEGYYRVIRHG